MVKTAVQLYTLRNVELPFDELLERVADAGFDGVEFAYRVTEEEPEDVVAVLEETGLEPAAAHVSIEDLKDEFEDTVAFYEALGVEEIVVPWLDEEFFSSRDGVADAVDRLAAVEERLSERGLALHYHNHDHEYVDCDGRPGFHVFVDESDVDLELDLGFVRLAGDDPAERIRAVGDRCRLAHLKDFDLETGEDVPVGEGDLDLEACGDAVADVGGEWLIYEYEGEDPLETLPDVAETMRSLV